MSADELDDSKEWLPLESLKTRKKYLSRKRYLFFYSLSTFSFLIDYFKCIYSLIYLLILVSAFAGRKSN